MTNLDLPSKICFRVTRFCNARCGFCLAPPDGSQHPAAALLRWRIDWLFEHGVRTIHFCGGEPTIHQDLPKLIAHVGLSGRKSNLTTNGIALSKDLVSVLYKYKTRVKVSLHGDQEHHDRMVGRAAFPDTTATIKRLVSEGVATCVQTTITCGRLDIVSWIIDFCKTNKVPAASFLPFIPRGNGFAERNRYELCHAERCELHKLIKAKRREHSGTMDIRLLDFNSGAVPVVEPDGRVILEGASETRDILLCQIPEKRPTLASPTTD